MQVVRGKILLGGSPPFFVEDAHASPFYYYQITSTQLV